MLGISTSIVSTGQSLFSPPLALRTPPLWRAAREVSHRLYDRHQSYLFRQQHLIFMSVFLVSFILLFATLRTSEFQPHISDETDSERLGRETHPSPPILSSLCLTVRVVGPLPGRLKSWLNRCGIWGSTLHVLIVGILIASQWRKL